MRQLATVRKIKEVRQIPGADNIETAVVDGWEVVIKRGEFKPGDLGIYFEIDSFLPERPEFEFLRKSSFKTFNGQPGFRLKTVKLRKQLSQGLLLPLATFGLENEKEGADVTTALGVIKYDVEEQGSASTPKPPKGFFARLFDRLFWRFRKRPESKDFPSFIPKTDETRIQNLTVAFPSFAGLKYVATEKLDGSSFTAYRKGKEFGVCSRNLRLEKDPANRWWELALRYDIENILKQEGEYAIQGEMVGPDVQGNKYKLKERDLYVFNIYDINSRCYLAPDEVLRFCKRNDLNMVPWCWPGDEFNFADVAAVLKYAEGPSALCSTQEREGVVFVLKENGKRSRSFKAISNKFLLKDEG